MVAARLHRDRGDHYRRQAHDGDLMELTMATTIPGAPHPDESEPNTLPVEPEFAPVIPDEPREGEHEPVPKPAH
jgi:hypothetical protein